MRRLVLGFPGQGSQKTGMGQALSAAFPQSAGKVFEEANAVLDNLFTDLVWTAQENPSMHQTCNAQPIILTTSIATLAALKERHGFEIAVENTKCLVGHSLGEYSCLVAANSLTLRDALLLVRKRGEFMQQACLQWNKTPSMCAVVNLKWDQALEIQSQTPKGLVCEAANDNGKEQIVLSGCEQGIDWGVARAKQMHGARRAIKIKGVSCSFHSSVMRPAADMFATELSNVELKQPTVPIIMGENVHMTQDADDIRGALVRGIYSPVRWAACLQQICEPQLEFREIGGSTLRFGLEGWQVGKPVRADPQDIEAF